MATRAFNIPQSRYQTLIGTGGIGTGVFFALHDNRTLGREESRGGHFVPRRDYCKLHIVAHYVATLLGSLCRVFPIGQVGDDAAGHELLREMKNAGMELCHVTVAPGEQTLYSFCFSYPDGSGGNLTTDDSACAHVTPAQIRRAEADFRHFAGRGIALAMPEVPLSTRTALLELGTGYGFLRTASFLATEMEAVRNQALLAQVDLLAINVDEAMALAGLSQAESPVHVVHTIIDLLQRCQWRTQLSITAGSRGSWSWDGQTLVHVPAFPVPVVSTAGAGDAHFAGILVGLSSGLTLAQAQELGTLVAALAVTSADTINFAVEQQALAELAARLDFPFSPALRLLLEEHP